MLALLAEMEAAAEARDADRLGELLAADFRLPDGLGKAVAVAEARRYFTIYETVGLNVYGTSVERGQGTARVQCIMEFSGQAKKLPGFEGFAPPEDAYRFDFELVQQGSRWLFRSARWERAEPAAGGSQP